MIYSDHGLLQCKEVERAWMWILASRDRRRTTVLTFEREREAKEDGMGEGCQFID